MTHVTVTKEFNPFEYNLSLRPFVSSYRHSFCGYVHADGEDEAAYSKRYPQNDLFNGHFTSDQHSESYTVL